MARLDIITIGGKPGSGKSTASKAAAAELGFEHFSSGDMMRELGAQQGLDILSTNHAAHKDDKLDALVDEKLRELGQTSSNLVIDSRMAWHWIPGSFKVFLDMPNPIVAAERIINASDPARLEREHIPSDPNEYAEQLVQREQAESARYLAKYGVDPFDPKNYDLVVDTSCHDQKSTLQVIIASYHVARHLRANVNQL